MKSLISVTPREFKRRFGEVMEMCTDMCMTTNQEIIIVIPKKEEWPNLRRDSQSYASKWRRQV